MRELLVIDGLRGLTVLPLGILSIVAGAWLVWHTVTAAPPGNFGVRVMFVTWGMMWVVSGFPAIINNDIGYIGIVIASVAVVQMVVELHKWFIARK